jgi:HAMP domain-containing protein
MILPLPLVIVAVIAVAWIIVPRVIADNATDEAVRASSQTATQFKTIRAYYTDNVVSKVAKDGTFKPSHDHKGNDKAIPLPATMIHDLSELLSGQDTTISLYSRYPFPNRQGRQLDPFQQEAWEFLSHNPQASFSRPDMRNGSTIVRVAVADVMTGQGCVNCHNSRADSPKKDWKVGDVRGVLEVTSVIDAQLAHGASLSKAIMIGAALIGLLLVGVALLVARSVTGPLGGMVSAMKRLASGDTSIAVPGVGRRDEIGVMAAAVDVFKQRMADAGRLRAEQAEHEQRVAVDKKTAMRKIADDFHRAIGTIVDTVFSAATELQATAKTLTRTAETTQQLSNKMVTTSEEASSNVRSVASASEQLAGSVAEIGTQVQESARIAQDAVGQAERSPSCHSRRSASATWSS